MKIANAHHCNNVTGVKICLTELQDFPKTLPQEKVQFNTSETEFATQNLELFTAVTINNLQEPQDIYNF